MFPTGQGRTAATAQKRPLADFWSIEHDAPLAGATFRSRMLPILALGSMQDPPAKAMKVLRTGERVDVVFSEPGCVRRWFLRALVVPAGAARPLLRYFRKSTLGGPDSGLFAWKGFVKRLADCQRSVIGQLVVMRPRIVHERLDQL
jgi:hypothetical protein